MDVRPRRDACNLHHRHPASRKMVAMQDSTSLAYPSTVNVLPRVKRGRVHGASKRLGGASWAANDLAESFIYQRRDLQERAPASSQCFRAFLPLSNSGPCRGSSPRCRTLTVVAHCSKTKSWLADLHLPQLSATSAATVAVTSEEGTLSRRRLFRTTGGAGVGRPDGRMERSSSPGRNGDHGLPIHVSGGLALP